MMKAFLENSHLFGANAPFIEELYDAYLQDPNTVSGEWRAYFDTLQKASGVVTRDISHAPIVESFARRAREGLQAMVASRGDAEHARKQVSVLQLISAHRFLGSRQANIDPLKRLEKPYLPDLDPAHYGLSEADKDSVFNTGSLVGPEQATLREIIDSLRATYCGNIGVEYMYITDMEQKRWIQNRFESIRSKPSYSPEVRRHLLERITAAETLERYLHTRYVGQKRFSLEGSETTIPILEAMIQRAGGQGVQEIVLGMAHRGRLNVLVNVMGKVPKDLFAEFEGKHGSDLPSGDVKYHMGFSSDVNTPGGPVHLTLAFNPSHLEIVNAVVEGSVRARQERRRDRDGKQVLPVLIHGDAAFAGQGVVMETMALSQTRGYRTGGTVHVVINNQIGFTTSDPRDTRSSIYCTDIAKMTEVPVFHVNGDDPEAALLAMEIAVDFRMQFGKDAIVDLVCFRRLGHNEQDEPLVTQPLMYKKIAQHPGTRKLYAMRLAEEGVVSETDAENAVKTYRAILDAGQSTNNAVIYNHKPAFAVDWTPHLKVHWETIVETAVPLKRLRELSENLTSIPDNFKLHPTVERVVAARRDMGQGKQPLDWGMAETLAYGTLLQDGYAVRISGQDSGRGTFSHRHAVLHDQNREKWDAGTYVPLRNVFDGQPNFLVIDSLLSEEAVLGFEYGFATADPRTMVIWEAQFGDFANGAQVVIDQFISSGETKWGRLCGLTMFLPHGYEGQGPEHSSARIERYLQLCAEHNIQVCVPSTPAQFFHLLRRQMVRPMRKPLVVITPKSLLRRKESTSDLNELASGSFKTVIEEIDAVDAKKVKRVVACSGKIFFDLLAERRARKITDIALIRLEQLYPFPHAAFKAEMQRHPKATSVIWAQEEPGNQGAWHRIQHYLLRNMRDDQELAYALRPSSASPAVGYLAKHNEQQKAVLDAALTI